MTKVVIVAESQLFQHFFQFTPIFIKLEMDVECSRLLIKGSGITLPY